MQDFVLYFEKMCTFIKTIINYSFKTTIDRLNISIRNGLLLCVSFITKAGLFGIGLAADLT